MNFALAILVICLVGAAWTAVGVRLWCGPSVVDDLERDPETVARRRLKETWRGR